jgi:dolichol-phosphate mannosyltransferase
MISVVVPCYNEREVVKALHQRLTAAAESWDEPFEVVIVDDGSLPDSWAEVAKIAEADSRWRVIRFSRNFGHQTAVSAGLSYASGDAVLVIDADLQDPPEVLGQFIRKWREGYEVVFAVRRKRKEGLFKRAAYALFYRFLGRLSKVKIPYDSGDFCLMDRKVVDLLVAMPEQNRFVRGMRAWAGFRQVGIEYERQARVAGETHYSLIKLINLAVDGVFSFSTIPLRLVTYLGIGFSMVALVGAVFTIAQKVFEPQFAKIGLRPVPGFATTVVSVLFLGGVQLISLGIIGEYVGRIYDEVKRRPLWVVRETRNISPGTLRVKDAAATAPKEKS